MISCLTNHPRPNLEDRGQKERSGEKRAASLTAGRQAAEELLDNATQAILSMPKERQTYEHYRAEVERLYDATVEADRRSLNPVLCERIDKLREDLRTCRWMIAIYRCHHNEAENEEILREVANWREAFGEEGALVAKLRDANDNLFKLKQKTVIENKRLREALNDTHYIATKATERTIK